MATAKTITDLKKILKSPRIGMIEVMRQVNAKAKSRYFMVVEDDRYPISKALYDHLGSLAQRTDTIHTTQKYGCWNHYKTLMLNC
ncbi:hypothetical protein MUB04_15225 [Acinetobacter indicus]|uniref:hypothetical protein n=1 Tax=Acinetobacter TaxID=469 RepID=UPI0015D148D7|nr:MULTISPECIES: hypothetical protein [Acinetobacter]MCP0917887.1 hypothetical protein [Acinetobacter indicus]